MKKFWKYVNSIKQFRSDCHYLIEKFRTEEKNDYKTFVALWVKLKFNITYEKYINSCLDDGGFKEDSLQIAKLIMLNKHFVGGLFLLFGLYYVQEDPKSHIRLDHNELENIMQNIRKDRGSFLETFQPGLLVAKLMKNNAFYFCRFSREYTIEGQRRAHLVFTGQQNFTEHLSVQPEDWLAKISEDKMEIDESNIFKMIKEVNQKYSKLKEELKKDNPQLNLNLELLPKNTIDGLQKHLTRDVSTYQAEVPQPPTVGEIRQKLKNRKMILKRRYAKPDDKDVDQPSTSLSSASTSKKLMRMKRFGYLKVMVNESDDNTSCTSEEENDLSGGDAVLEFPDL